MPNDWPLPGVESGTPPKWRIFDKHVARFGPWAFGFKTTAAKVNRFKARYRVAKPFKGAEFEDLSAGTCAGYSAFLGHVLIYSAFEHFIRAIPMTLAKADGLLGGAKTDQVIARLHSLDQGDSLVSFMKPHLNPTHKRHLGNYLQGNSCNPFYLVSGVRHLFVHGVLTPNPSSGAITSVVPVCQYMREVLLETIDITFEAKMDAFILAHPGL